MKMENLHKNTATEKTSVPERDAMYDRWLKRNPNGNYEQYKTERMNLLGKIAQKKKVPMTMDSTGGLVPQTNPDEAGELIENYHPLRR